MTVVDLPAPSPALLVHEAAALLRRTAERAAADAAESAYWSASWANGITNALGGAVGDLAALFPPELAEEIADWLDARAAANVRFGDRLPALALKFVEAVQS